MPILPTANLKNTKHINLLLRSAEWSRDLAARFLDWLERRSAAPVAQQQRDAHLDELERRVAGRSLVSVSEETGTTLRELRFMPMVLRHFAYAPLQRSGLEFSFDVFNAGNELSIGREAGEFGLELFAIEGRGIAPLVELAIEAVREWPVEYAFGGHHTFTAGYALAQMRAKEAGRRLRIQDFLWPFTFSRAFAGLNDEELQQLPVFRTGRAGEGVWVWVFDDLYLGHSEAYLEAARALGLRSLWEPEFLQTPEGA